LRNLKISKRSNLPEVVDSKYEQFLRGLRLISVSLKSCSASVDRTGLFKLMNKKDGPTRIFRHAYKTTQIGTNFFEAAGAFIVNVQESEPDRPALHVECEFEAHLHGPEPISKAYVERFVDSEFGLILVPYARQFVSATTAQMSIPPLVIPLSVGDDPPKNKGVVRSKKAEKSHAKAR
jgi:hypothetical protein